MHTCFTLFQESNIDEWKETAVTSIDLLCAMIEREDARLEENISATEEALGDVIKIMKYCDEKMVGIGRMNEVHFDPFIIRRVNVFQMLDSELRSGNFYYNFFPDSQPFLVVVSIRRAAF